MRSKKRAIKGHVLLDDKTANRLRRIRWRRLAMASAVVSALVSLFLVYHSPLLRVNNIEVLGAATVDPAEVEALAAFDGYSMFRLGDDGARARIDNLPMVKSVNIERLWPDTVRIVVEERIPWGVWQVGKDRYVIDTGGVVLPANVKAPKGAPTIVDLGNPVRLLPGDLVDQDTVTFSQSLIKSVPRRFGSKVTALQYSPERGLTVTTDARYHVVVGDSQNMDYKLAVWQAIEERLGREAMAGHVLDLRFGERPSFH